MTVADAYARVQGLENGQIAGVLAGLSREQVHGLNSYQVEGVQMGLSAQQVRVNNFRYDAVRGIRTLMERDGMTVADAYARVQGLEDDQIAGVLARSQGQVQANTESLRHIWASRMQLLPHSINFDQRQPPHLCANIPEDSSAHACCVAS